MLLSLPYDAETHGLVGAEQLACMKPTAHLLNVARALVVDERALYDALSSRAIAGAALDVWYHEPSNPNEMATPLLPANLPFWELDNVLHSPHASALTTTMWARRMTVIRDNVLALQAGRTLVNVVHRAPNG